MFNRTVLSVMLAIMMSLYFISLFAGAWTLHHCIAVAPEGYEDELGFHVISG
ncbi:MAG: hypothetical protein P8L49_05450 [Opitutaceae bacterium]|nr:hypothetical protein [Opitutaceae bacterium]